MKMPGSATHTIPSNQDLRVKQLVLKMQLQEQLLSGEDVKLVTADDARAVALAVTAIERPLNVNAVLRHGCETPDCAYSGWGG